MDQGAVCIVTGGASGLGVGIVTSLAATGARVVVADVDTELGPGVAAEAGGVFRRCDVASEDEVAELVAWTRGELGSVDVMCNNAGIADLPCSLLDADEQDWRHVLQVDLLGVVFGMKHAGRVMKEQGRGSIINTGSPAGMRAGTAPHAYSVAKAAMSAATRCAALEFGEFGVRVNAVLPGLFATPIYTRHVPPEARAGVVAQLQANAVASQPLERPGVPSDIGEVVRFLASDASSFVTGQEIVVDGGSGIGVKWSSYLGRLVGLLEM